MEDLPRLADPQALAPWAGKSKARVRQLIWGFCPLRRTRDQVRITGSPCEQPLLQELRIEPPVDFMLMAGVAVGLKRGNQGMQSRGKDNQVTGTLAGGVGVGNACGHEHGFPSSHRLDSVRIPKHQFTFEDVPCFVVGMVNVQSGWAAASPFMNLK